MNNFFDIAKTADNNDDNIVSDDEDQHQLLGGDRKSISNDSGTLQAMNMSG